MYFTRTSNYTIMINAIVNSKYRRAGYKIVKMDELDSLVNLSAS